MTLSETNNMMKLVLLMMTDSVKVCSVELMYKKDHIPEPVDGKLPSLLDFDRDQFVLLWVVGVHLPALRMPFATPSVKNASVRPVSWEWIVELNKRIAQGTAATRVFV